MRKLQIVTGGCLLGVLVLVGCADPGESLRTGVDDLVVAIEDSVGATTLPQEHIDEIRHVHEPSTWRFRPQIEDALPKTRTAVRGLADSDYGTWTEVALAVQILSSMAEEHPSALVRSEAMDALARMASWTLAAQVETGDWATETEMIGALKIIKKATTTDDVSHPELSFQVADAIRTLGAFDFEAGLSADDTRTRSAVKRDVAGRLRNARGVLFPLTSKSLDGFRGDPEVREAIERSSVTLCATVMRLTLAYATVADPSPNTRSSAGENLSTVRSTIAGDLLRRLVQDDVDAGVRRRIASALATYPMETAVPLLVSALADDMPGVRGAASRSLEALTGERLGQDRLAWRDWWRKHETRVEAPSDSPPSGGNGPAEAGH